jgi:hypothetical protein
MSRKPLIAGNWKMNLNHFEAIALVQKIAFSLPDKYFDKVDVAVIPPFTDLRSVQTLVDGDKLRLTYGAQDLSPHDSGHRHPAEAAQDHEDDQEVPPQHGHDDDDQEHVGQPVEDVDEAHHEAVHLAPQESRDGAVPDADEQADAGRQDSHRERNMAPVKGADHQVAPVRVRSHPVLSAGGLLGLFQRLAAVVVGREERDQGRGESDREEEPEADHGPPVLPEAPERQVGRAASLDGCAAHVSLTRGSSHE